MAGSSSVRAGFAQARARYPGTFGAIRKPVLSTLWRNRSRRQPCLIVIDEAHNVCPAKPADAVMALATNFASLIAAEGRKFGLYLLTSTQRPQKVHEEVLSLCDNLLMRMNSEADLGLLRDAFSFVPSWRKA